MFRDAFIGLPAAGGKFWHLLTLVNENYCSERQSRAKIWNHVPIKKTLDESVNCVYYEMNANSAISKLKPGSGSYIHFAFLEGNLSSQMDFRTIIQ